MARYISFRDFDWVLFVFVLIICGLGVMEIRSATEHTKFAGSHIKQLYWIVGGVRGMFLVSFFNYQVLLERVHWMYIASLGSIDGRVDFRAEISGGPALGKTARRDSTFSLPSGSS